jgi:hypothetical protein
MPWRFPAFASAADRRCPCPPARLLELRSGDHRRFRGAVADDPTRLHRTYAPEAVGAAATAISATPYGGGTRSFAPRIWHATLTTCSRSFSRPTFIRTQSSTAIPTMLRFTGSHGALRRRSEPVTVHSTLIHSAGRETRVRVGLRVAEPGPGRGANTLQAFHPRSRRPVSQLDCRSKGGASFRPACGYLRASSSGPNSSGRCTLPPERRSRNRPLKVMGDPTP